jgi:hypothetical protein
MPTSLLTRFFGASVLGWQASAGWNEQASKVTIKLAEDTRNGDSFVSGVIGAPYSFTTSTGWRFDGILQHQERTRNASEYPVYEVMLSSPNELLDGVKLILGAYNGTTTVMNNLFNVYGYWENRLGFGGSLINDTGMVWQAVAVNVSGNPLTGGIVISSGGFYGVKPGIEAIQQNGTNYGSGIFYKGYKYQVNLSGLPVPPSYYRMGNNVSMTLREAIDQVCKDGGCEYIVQLAMNASSSGTHTININPVLLSGAPQLGKIAAFIATQSGLISSSQGAELLNDECSFFMTGADVQTLMLQTLPGQIVPFWGFDSNGSLISTTGGGGSASFNLNSVEIFDITGSNSYACTINELRCALSSQDMWAAFIQLNNTTLSNLLGIPSAFNVTEKGIGGLFIPVFNHDFIQNGPGAAQAFSIVNRDNTWTNRYNRVYQFVRGIAEQYYGKKFLVASPTLIQVKVEPETSRFIYSWEPTQGGWVDQLATPLGLSPLNQDYFANQDNTVGAFVRFDHAFSGDISAIPTQNSVIQGTDLYMPCRILDEYGVVFPLQLGVSPSYVVVELESPLFEVARDGLGSVNSINSIFGVDITVAANLRNDYIAGRLFPAAMMPGGAAIPMKSNQFTYGPWYTKGPDGKVRYEKSEDLAPWKYGGYDIMNNVANAKITNFVINAQQSEAGYVELPGLPSGTIGQALITGGPIISDINVQFGKDGVTTRYNMRTYTPRFGQFANERIRRLQNFGISLNNFRRTMRQMYRSLLAREQWITANNPSFMDGVSKAIRFGTSHPAMVAHLVQDPRDSGRYIPMVNLQTYAESVSNIAANPTGYYSQTTCVGLEGLFRPFVPTSGSTSLNIAQYKNASSQVPSTAITNGKLNLMLPPGGSHDIEWVTQGYTNYSGLHAQKNNNGGTFQPKLIGLKGPMQMVGWGYHYNLKPTPNSGGDTVNYQSMSSAAINRYGQRSDQWVAAPVSLFFNKYTACWDQPVSFTGKLTQTAPAYATSGVPASIIVNGTVTSDQLDVWNDLGTDIVANVKIKAAWDSFNQHFGITSADCVAT